MARLSSSNMTMSSASALHQTVDQLLASSSDPLQLLKHRETFQERALRDVTVNSNDSAMMLDPNNPLLVKEEMEAQKDYFRRLKFTYLEQEAKRNFLFSITGDEPQGVQSGENEELENINAQKKAALKTSKAEIEEMRHSAIQLARHNALRYVEIAKQVSEAQTIQKKVRDMELELARIKATHPPENRVTITQANSILDEQTIKMERVTEAIATTAQETESTREDLTRTAKELQRLGRDRDREEARAKEVQEGREAGDTKVDEMCRWLASSMEFYRNLMGIRSVRAASDYELHLEYDVPSSQSNTPADQTVTLMLGFDPTTKGLVAAELAGSDVDIGEVLNLAEHSNDIPGLIADVLVLLRPPQ